MLRGGMLAAVIAMLAACSSFAEDSPTTKDAGPAQSPRLTLRADPSLVVLEAGGRATVKVVVEHTSVPGAPLRDGFQVAGLPDGVSSLNRDKAIGVDHTFE